MKNGFIQWLEITFEGLTKTASWLRSLFESQKSRFPPSPPVPTYTLILRPISRTTRFSFPLYQLGGSKNQDCNVPWLDLIIDLSKLRNVHHSLPGKCQNALLTKGIQYRSRPTTNFFCRNYGFLVLESWLARSSRSRIKQHGISGGGLEKFPLRTLHPGGRKDTWFCFRKKAAWMASFCLVTEWSLLHNKHLSLTAAVKLQVLTRLRYVLTKRSLHCTWRLFFFFLNWCQNTSSANLIPLTGLIFPV